MKKIKLINTVFSTALLTGTLVPLVGCSWDFNQGQISVVSSQTKNYMHAVDGDPYPVFVLKLKNKLSDGQKLKVEVEDITGTKNVKCSVAKVDINDTKVAVSMKMEGFSFDGDLCQFTLKFTCQDSSDKTIWTNYHYGFRLIAGYTYGYFINNICDKTVEEFIEWSKNPHPSNQSDTHTSENDTLNLVRNYLNKKVASLGYKLNRDTYGNVWFDVPATDGYENYPELIIQGHMDMVAAGFENEYLERTTGIDVVKTTVTDAQSKVHEVLQSRGKVYPGFRKTSIGADDGIAIAIALALISNESFEHGPLRMLFTADEEVGLYGAINLDPSALNSDYLLSLDGEGNAENPIVIMKSCYGFNNYSYTNQFTSATKELNNAFKFTTNGFAGKHFYQEISYTKAGGEQIWGNPDALAWTALYNLTHDSNNYKVQLSKISHVLGDDEKKLASYMAHNATYTFVTDAPETAVKKAFDDVYTDAASKCKKEDWNSITHDVTAIADASSMKFLSTTDSSKLIQTFGKDIEYKIQHWDGNTEEEKEKNNYPTQCSNFSYTEIDDNLLFTGFSRGNASTNAYLDELDIKNSIGWTNKFGIEGLKKTISFPPWDVTGKEQLLDLTAEGYKSIGIEPYIMRARGGVEPAYFSKHRSTLQQAVIGPWLEGIHSGDETCYLETLPPVVKCILYIADNMWKFIK